MSQAIKRNSQTVRRMHTARQSRANGQPSKLKVFASLLFVIIVVLSFLSYSTARTTEAREQGARQYENDARSMEDEGVLIRSSLDGSTVDAAIKRSESY